MSTKTNLDAFTTVLIDLQNNLKIYFNDKSIENHSNCIAKCREIIETSPSINLNKTALLLRAILYPYMCLVLDEENSELAHAMISLVNWWLKVKPEKAPDKQLIDVIIKHKCYKADKLDVKSLIENKAQPQLIIASQSNDDSLEYLVKHFGYSDSASGHDCDNLIELIQHIMHYEDFKYKKLMFSCNFKNIWGLFFNPLMIKTACTSNGQILSELINTKVVKIPRDETMNSKISVTWTDNRRTMNRSNYMRKEVDCIMKECILEMSENDLNRIINEIDWEEIAEINQYKDYIVDKLESLMALQTIDIGDLLVNIKVKALFLITETELVLKLLNRFNIEKNRFHDKFFEDLIVQVNNEIKVKILVYLQHQSMESEAANQIEYFLSMYLLLLNSLKQANYHKLEEINISWLSDVIKNLLKTNSSLEIIKKIAKLFSEIINRQSLLIIFLSNFVESGDFEFLNIFGLCWCKLSLNVLMKNLNPDAVRVLKISVELASNKSESNSLDGIVKMGYLLSDILGLNENTEAKECFENKNFVMSLLCLLKKATEFNTKMLFLRLVIKISVRILDWKGLGKIIASQIIEYLPELMKICLEFDDLEMILSFLQETDKQCNSVDVCFIEEFLKILIKEAELDSNSNGIKSVFSDFSNLFCKEEITGSLKVDSFMKNLVDKRLVEIFKLVRKPNYQESVIKIICNSMNLSIREKELMYCRFVNSRYELKEKTINEDKKNIFFNNEENDVIINSKVEKIVKIEDFQSTVNALKRYKGYGKIDLLNSSHDKREYDEINELCMTDTAIENINMILQIIDDPIPILIEGSTGIGKSAAVIEAAKMSGNKLIRFNMSSHITIDDLLGKPMLQSDSNNQDKFSFHFRPFSIAFKEGYWLLLDELNLAQDIVLQSIESAIDTNVLQIFDPTSSTNSQILIHKHPKFRLLATQNPNTGFYKGKRENLSASFLDRFRTIVFRRFENYELIDIVKSIFDKNTGENEVEAISASIVEKIHVKIVEIINPFKGFPEWEAYSEVSMRDLLRLSKYIKSYIDKKIWTTICNPREKEILADLTFFVYGSKFRRNGRQKVLDTIKFSGLSVSKQKDVNDWEINENIIKFNHSVCNRDLNAIFDSHRTKLEYEWKARFKESFDSSFCYYAFNIHVEVEKACKSKDFLSQNGLYFVNMTWYWNWIEIGLKTSKKLDHQLLLGATFYSNKFSKSSQRDFILRIFEKNFEKWNLKFEKREFSSDYQKPFVMTKRVKSLWNKLNIAMMQNCPILITGNEGCGKSQAITAYGEIYGANAIKVCLTPESEPSILVGHLMPNDQLLNSNRIIWHDGVITEAIKTSSWIILDNLNQADSPVLERLNPVLEDPPIWNLTENGETESIKIPNEFRVFSTMSVATKGISTQQSYGELTPAFYNRFTIIHFEDINLVDEKEFKDEISDISDKILTNVSEKERSKILTLLWFHVNKYKQNATSVTFRNLVRFIDCFQILSETYSKKYSFDSILFTNYRIVFESQIKDLQSNEKQILENEILDLLGLKQKDLSKINFLEDKYKNKEHVFAGSRLQIAEALLAAVDCKLPILLEGPAAVGKTSMVSLLCKNSNVVSQLERVNNTNTTTIQDYFGSYIPTGDSQNPFVFKYGALTRAMINGWWFLSDEFNLAEPAVLNALFPLLEGERQIKIPGTSKVVITHKNFRFFATQNDAKYIGRNQLPISLRNRFLEIQFNDFEETELKQIILQRKIGGELDAYIDEKTAENVSKLYNQMKNTKFRLTMREIIKWLNRQALFQQVNREYFIKLYSYPQVLFSILGARFPTQLSTLQTNINDIWKMRVNTNEVANITKYDDYIEFKEGPLEVRVKGIQLNRSVLFQNRVPPPTFTKYLVRLAIALQNKEPVLLIGPTCFKSLLIQTWIEITNRTNDCEFVYLTSETETNELIGQINPFSYFEILDLIQKTVNLFLSRFHALNQIMDRNIDNTLECISKKIDEIPSFINKLKSIDLKDDNKLSPCINTRLKSFMPPQIDLGSIKPSFNSQFDFFDEDTSLDDKDNLDPYCVLGNKSENEEDYKLEEDEFPVEEDEFPVEEDEFPVEEDKFPVEEDDKIDFQMVEQDDFPVDEEEKSEIIHKPRNEAIDYDKSVDFEESKLTKGEDFEITVKFSELLQQLIKYFTELKHMTNDFVMENQITIIEQCLKHVKNTKQGDRSKPLFLFKDGPVTKCAKYGNLLCLEDFDAPSQAVTERLNSLLESDPSINIAEDINFTIGKSSNIRIPERFDVIATIHQVNSTILF